MCLMMCVQSREEEEKEIFEPAGLGNKAPAMGPGKKRP